MALILNRNRDRMMIAVALTTACYKALQSSNLYNQRMWSPGYRRGQQPEVGAGGGTDGLETIQASNFITQSDNGYGPVCVAFSVGWDRAVATSCCPVCLQAEAVSDEHKDPLYG